jgi:hypothetical protein
VLGVSRKTIQNKIREFGLEKTPVIPDNIQRILKWKKPGSTLISFHDISMASSPIINVRKSINRLRPSSARWIPIPNLCTQRAEYSSSHSVSLTEPYRKDKAKRRAMSIATVSSEIILAVRGFRLPAIQAIIPPAIKINIRYKDHKPI